MICNSTTEIQSMDRVEIVKELLGLKVTDIEILDSGKVCVFLENSEGRPYVIDSTGEKSVVTKFLTKNERFERLVEKLELMAEKLDIDLEKLLEEHYKEQ